MYIKPVTYTDYKGVKRTEEFCFNLTRAEIVDMELDVQGGMSATLDKISKSQDVPALIAVFRDLVKRSYGVISDDGRRFIKTPDLVEAFVQTPAYDEIYMSLVTDTNAAAEFINNIVPAEMAEQAKKAQLNAAN